MGKLAREDYPGVLSGLLDEEVSGVSEVVICGMAGARQGWLEAPYLDAPADLAGLIFSAVAPDMPDSQLQPRILPGVCQKASGAEDVMRGEETQLLGLSALHPGFSGLVIMPGTHSKWALLDGTKIDRFTTAMTGELFEVLKTHSVLRHSLQGDLDGPERSEGFAAGLAIGIEHPERLTATLFKVRAGSLLSGYLGGRMPKQILLASIYLARAVAIALFMLFPVTEVTAYMFAGAMGLLWLSTVPPTAGLVTVFFGARYMGMLYGIAFLSHQIGSFVGVWLGGYVFDVTGSYNLVWYLGVLLGLASAAVHLPIREMAAPLFRGPAPQPAE